MQNHGRLAHRVRVAAAAATVWASFQIGQTVYADGFAASSASPAIGQLQAGPAGASATESIDADAKALANVIPTLPADEAARRWLALSERQRASLNPERRFLGNTYRPSTDFEKILAALPTAEQLPALKAALDARPLDGDDGQRVALLKMLVATLRGLPEDLDAAFADLRTAAIARGTPADRIDRRFAEFRQALASPTGTDASDAIAEFERAIDQGDHGFGRTWPVDVPDLVSLVGEAKARELLERGLKSGRLLQVQTGDETRKLAQSMALASIESAPVPQWALCQDVNAVDLYEATLRKFPVPEPAKAAPAAGPIGLLPNLIRRPQPVDSGDRDPYASERNEARPYYLLGLIVRGRSDDAMRVAQEMKASGEGESTLSGYAMANAVDQLYRQGFAEQIYQFLKRVVVAEPDAPVWETLVASAARSGHADEVLTIARDAAAKPGQTPASQRTSNRNLAAALLAADQVDEGANLLKANLADDEDARFQTHIRLATIGRLAGREALVHESLDAATAILRDAGEEASHDLDGWCREMRLAGRHDALSPVLAARVAKLDADDVEYSVPDAITQLAAVHYDHGSAKDVIAMLDGFPHWGKTDLAKLTAATNGEPRPMLYYAAWALLRSGDQAAGLKALDLLLNERGGLDAAYELLIDNDPNAEAKLAAMLARDPFEERPLIWQAVLHQRAFRTEQAEATLKQAIAIDPSDGEQGKGDRMRVYAILADVMAAKGDAKQAEFLRGVVKAIRLSEDADDAWQAGLLSRAVRMYEESLTHFADAYCVQSRLAVQLAELGREAEAEEHYRRAYELMPDSFGRVESHCFGCEGAFRTQQAKSIAERVFTQLLAKEPTKPQLHYLLGYLRKAEGRWGEARAAFREAVRLDPKYLNAWKSLLECGDHVALDAAEQEEATLALITLDPLSRHSSPSAEKVDDVAKLYAAASTAQQLRPVKPESIYPLRAAAAALAAPRDPSDHTTYFSSWTFDSSSSPGKLVADHPRVKPIVEWMDEFGQ